MKAAFRVVDEKNLTLRLNWAEINKKEIVKKEVRKNKRGIISKGGNANGSESSQ